jgi:hypothetical protein
VRVRALADTNIVPGFLPARRSDQPQDIESKITALARVDVASLRDRWRRVFGRQAPSGLGREFMVRVLAYRLQAEVLGDLDRKTVRALDQLAASNIDAVIRDRLPGRHLHPGTELIREYQGQQYRVTVVRDGFSWNGATYTTLSGVAKAITGSNWNGYVFFGLTERHHDRP